MKYIEPTFSESKSKKRLLAKRAYLLAIKSHLTQIEPKNDPDMVLNNPNVFPYKSGVFDLSLESMIMRDNLWIMIPFGIVSFQNTF